MLPAAPLHGRRLAVARRPAGSAVAALPAASPADRGQPLPTRAARSVVPGCAAHSPWPSPATARGCAGGQVLHRVISLAPRATGLVVRTPRITGWRRHRSRFVHTALDQQTSPRAPTQKVPRCSTPARSAGEHLERSSSRSIAISRAPPARCQTTRDFTDTDLPTQVKASAEGRRCPAEHRGSARLPPRRRWIPAIANRQARR